MLRLERVERVVPAHLARVRVMVMVMVMAMVRVQLRGQG
jgi:hypothetical protein